jgi:hypothetical protein
MALAAYFFPFCCTFFSGLFLAPHTVDQIEIMCIQIAGASVTSSCPTLLDLAYFTFSLAVTLTSF